MTLTDIVRLRLSNQKLSNSSCTTPQELVSLIGAVQAQDFMGAKWAIGLRLPNCIEGDVLDAIENKKIVRSWPMRGTLHFVDSKDLRWMLKLLAVRSIPKMSSRFRQLELDERTLLKGSELLVSLLQGGKRKTRDEIYEMFESHGISYANQRGIHILGKAAHDGLICFGAPKGKEQTFVLLDEWLPPSTEYSREESLEKIAIKYFSSHGPATLHDFVWWTGLSVSDARLAIELAKSSLWNFCTDENSYWMGGNVTTAKSSSGIVQLLPPFDEYLVGYKNRFAALDINSNSRSEASLSYLLSPTILVDGRVVGIWRRNIHTEQITISTDLFRKITKEEKDKIQEAAKKYAAFFGKTVVCK